MKLSAILLDVRVSRGGDIGSDHSLTSTKSAKMVTFTQEHGTQRKYTAL